MTKKENLPVEGAQLDETVGKVLENEEGQSHALLAKPFTTEKDVEPKIEKKEYVAPKIEVVEDDVMEEPVESSPVLKDESVIEGQVLIDEKPKEKKRGKRRAQSTGGPPVMAIDAKRTVETDADKAKNDLIDLTESLKADKILTGKVQGIERNFQGYDSVAVLYHGVFKVVIPVEDMVEKPQNVEERSLEDAYYYLGMRRLGAEVDYVVNSVFYDEMLAVASRLDAMQIKRKRFYRGGAGSLVHEGVRAEARIVSVIRAGIFVDVFGVECFVPLRELSYQRIGNATAQFRTGDRVIVKVLSVDNKDMSNIKIQVSVKQASINPYEFALKKYSVGNRYVGTVSMVDKNGVFVALDGGVDCLCRFPARGRPMKGANVTVQILGIDEKSNRIWGIITHSSMVL